MNTQRYIVELCGTSYRVSEWHTDAADHNAPEAYSALYLEYEAKQLAQWLTERAAGYPGLDARFYVERQEIA